MVGRLPHRGWITSAPRLGAQVPRPFQVRDSPRSLQERYPPLAKHPSAGPRFLALSFEVIDLSRLFQSVKLDKLPIAQNGRLSCKLFQGLCLVADDHNVVRSIHSCNRSPAFLLNLTSVELGMPSSIKYMSNSKASMRAKLNRAFIPEE